MNDTMTFQEILAHLPATRATPAYAGDIGIYMQTVIAAAIAEAREDAAKPPAGDPWLCVRPAGESGWLYIGEANRLTRREMSDAMDATGDDWADSVEFSIVHMTADDVANLPEFDGW